jgi:hypothetical protein
LPTVLFIPLKIRGRTTNPALFGPTPWNCRPLDWPQTRSSADLPRSPIGERQQHGEGSAPRGAGLQAAGTRLSHVPVATRGTPEVHKIREGSNLWQTRE